MLNLLIREDRHWLRKEYFQRFFLILSTFFVFFALVWGVIIFSFYIQIRVESKILSDQLEELQNSSNAQSIREMSNLNDSIDNKISQFDILNFNQSDILKEVVSIENDGINLNLISTNLIKDEDGNIFAQIEINGLSEDRDSLVNYQDNLGKSFFETVEIPFSSFVKNINIPFTAKLKTTELNQYFDQENEN